MVENTKKQDAFGWTYHHFVDPSGMRVNVVNHQTDIFGLEKRPYMTMIAKEPNTVPLRFKGEPNFDWEINSSTKDGNFNFEFNNARFTGTIKEINGSDELIDIVLYQDKLGRKSHWAVDIPYGKVSGKLCTQQEEREIAGYVYQDRQWGDILIQEWVKNWTWTHLANKNLFVVIFCINTIDKQRSWHSIFSQGQEILTSNNPEVPYFSKLIGSEHPDKEILQGEIRIPDKLSANFLLQPNNVMRSRMEENHPGFSASYIRWSIDDIIDHNDPVHGIAEYMEINKL